MSEYHKENVWNEVSFKQIKQILFEFLYKNMSNQSDFTHHKYYYGHSCFTVDSRRLKWPYPQLTALIYTLFSPVINICYLLPNSKMW